MVQLLQWLRIPFELRDICQEFLWKLPNVSEARHGNDLTVDDVKIVKREGKFS